MDSRRWGLNSERKSTRRNDPAQTNVVAGLALRSAALYKPIPSHRAASHGGETALLSCFLRETASEKLKIVIGSRCFEAGRHRLGEWIGFSSILPCSIVPPAPGLPCSRRNGRWRCGSGARGSDSGVAQACDQALNFLRDHL